MSRILLVDDNGSVLLTLAIALRRLGHEVTTAANGTQALAYLFNHRFDVVVSDVRMPDMSGVQLANIIRQRQAAPRVILTSAYSTLEAHQDVAEAFLRKPVDIAQLDEMLRHAPHSEQNNSTSDSDFPSSTRCRAKRRNRRRSWFSLRPRDHANDIERNSESRNKNAQSSFGDALPA